MLATSHVEQPRCTRVLDDHRFCTFRSHRTTSCTQPWERSVMAHVLSRYAPEDKLVACQGTWGGDQVEGPRGLVAQHHHLPPCTRAQPHTHVHQWPYAAGNHAARLALSGIEIQQECIHSCHILPSCPHECPSTSMSRRNEERSTNEGRKATRKAGMGANDIWAKQQGRCRESKEPWPVM